MNGETSTDRAPAPIRYGLPGCGGVLFIALVIAAAFTGTADWGLAIPIGIVTGVGTLVVLTIVLRRRGLGVLLWIDDYWHRED